MQISPVAIEIVPPGHRHRFGQSWSQRHRNGAMIEPRIIERIQSSSSFNTMICVSVNARDGVSNSHGQTHDMANLFISDGSQFTSSAAENPKLAIVGLAIRQADYIARQQRG
jgi:hypothetical protein